GDSRRVPGAATSRRCSVTSSLRTRGGSYNCEACRVAAASGQLPPANRRPKSVQAIARLENELALDVTAADPGADHALPPLSGQRPIPGTEPSRKCCALGDPVGLGFFGRRCGLDLTRFAEGYCVPLPVKRAVTPRPRAGCPADAGLFRRCARQRAREEHITGHRMVSPWKSATHLPALATSQAEGRGFEARLPFCCSLDDQITGHCPTSRDPCRYRRLAYGPDGDRSALHAV